MFVFFTIVILITKIYPAIKERDRLRPLDYKTRVYILSSFIVVLLIAGGIGLLYYLKKHPKTNEISIPSPPPVAEPSPEEKKPVVPPAETPESQPSQNVSPEVNTQRPIKTPVSGPE